MLHTFQATGTFWHINIWDKLNPSFEKQVIKNIKNYIKKEELIFSRFNENSEISRFSRGEKNGISDEFYNALFFAEEMEKLSNGVFNPKMGKILKSQGYGKINGSNLDFGAFIKGRIVDDIKEILIKNGIDYFLINGGGDIYASTNFKKEISIKVEFINQNFEVRLKNKAICTSNNGIRKWKIGESEFVHVANASVKSVCIIHDSCMIADLIATVSLISGEKYWAKFKERFGEFKGKIEM